MTPSDIRVAPSSVAAETAPSRAREPFPGFDGLRLFAALTVVFSHAYLIATGGEHDEPFVRFLGPGNIVGLYGVFSFFAISGFLLARSLDRNRSLAAFISHRLLRIYPGFVFCVLVVALAIGPCASSVSPGGYLTAAEPYVYVGAGLTCLCDAPALPGVFAYAGPVSQVVNGSLWSLPYELLSYVFLLWLWLVTRSAVRTAVAMCAVALVVQFVPGADRHLASVAYTLPYFAGGVAMYPFYRRFGTHVAGAAVCGAGLAISAHFGVQQIAFALFGTYLIVFIGERPNPGSRLAARFGDLSYGIYLFGWPMEQLVRTWTGATSPYVIMLAALPLIVGAAALSRHAVEVPALRMRSAFARLLGTLASASADGRRAWRVGASALAIVAVPAILTSETVWWYVSPVVLAVGLLAVLCGKASARFAGRRPNRRDHA